MSLHEYEVKYESDQNLFESYFKIKPANSVPLCKTHYNDFSKFRNVESCTACNSKFQHRDGKSSKRYNVLSYHVETFNQTLQDDDLDVSLHAGDVICTTCYKRLSGTSGWRLDRLEDIIDIPSPTPSNIHYRAANKTAIYIISKFKDSRSVLLSDMHEKFNDYVEEDCTQHSVSDDDKYRKTANWLKIYLMSLISENILGCHTFQKTASSGPRTRLSCLLYCKLLDPIEMLHLSVYDARVKTSQKKNEINVNCTDTEEPIVQKSLHADLHFALKNVNRYAKESISKVKSDYKGDDLVKAMTHLSFHSLYESVHPWLWNAVWLLTMTNTEEKYEDLILDFSKKHTVLFEDEETPMSSQKKVRRLMLCYMIFLIIDPDCTYPLPVLLTDLIRSYSGSTELVKHLNRLGFCASIDTHDRYMNAIATIQNKVSPLERLIPQHPLIITMDNLDWMIRNAMVRPGGKLSHHVTTVQGIQTKVDKHHPFSEPRISPNIGFI